MTPTESLPPLNSDAESFDVHAVTPEERNERLRADLERTLPWLERMWITSQATQEEIQEFRERYDRLPPDTPLPPRSLRKMHRGRSGYLRLQGHLIGLARRYESLLRMEVGPLGVDAELRARGVLTSFCAALALYDNFLSMRFVLEDPRLRRLIDNPARGYGMEEQAVLTAIGALNADTRRARLRRFAQGYVKVSDELDAMQDPAIRRLRMAIESSATFRYALRGTLRRHLPTEAKQLRERVMDKLDALGRDTLGALSQLFGNGIGMVEMRKGKLWQDPGVEQHLAGVLRPLDMLLEKTPFRLTDKFIPGHFGHVAVWLGTYEEVQALGLWSDPLFEQPAFASCPEDLRKGRSIVEALRTGVQLSTLAEFLNVDDVAILRPRSLTEKQERSSLLRAFSQVGKQYDFNFEVETVDKITCSELAYHVYPGVDWQTDQQLGQYTISPDQVASQALGSDGVFELVALYHDGTRIDPAEAALLFERLLKEGQG